MTGQQDKTGRQTASRMTDARQDRLGRALRENLKRRKSQAKERQRDQERDGQRDKMTAAPSKHHEGALDDDTGSGGR
jgi:hypothetical protein